MGDDQCISLTTLASDVMTSGISPYLEEMWSEGGDWAVLTVVKGGQTYAYGRIVWEMKPQDKKAGLGIL